jgi:hypothetical protein
MAVRAAPEPSLSMDVPTAFLLRSTTHARTRGPDVATEQLSAHGYFANLMLPQLLLARSPERQIDRWCTIVWNFMKCRNLQRRTPLYSAEPVDQNPHYRNKVPMARCRQHSPESRWCRLYRRLPSAYPYRRNTASGQAGLSSAYRAVGHPSHRYRLGGPYRHLTDVWPGNSYADSLAVSIGLGTGPDEATLGEYTR